MDEPISGVHNVPYGKHNDVCHFLCGRSHDSGVKDMAKDFHMVIAEEMEKKGIKRKDLYPIFNDNRSRISEVLSGKRNVPRGKIISLARLLGIEVERLI